MAVQASTDFEDTGLKLRGELRSQFPETIEQDAGRSGALSQWTVMSKKKVTVPTTGAATGTGNGTMTAVAAGGPLKIGTYVLTCTFAITNGGVFKLEDPDGNIVADNLTLRVGAGLLTSFNVGGLIFTITDGSTDFVAADLFDVAVTANGKYVPLDPAGLDGSGEFAGIYNGEDITEAAIIAGDTEGEIITGGSAAVLDEDKLDIETGTLATILISGKSLKEEMNDKGLFPASTSANYRAENA